jgi:hypothetical protein
MGDATIDDQLNRVAKLGRDLTRIAGLGPARTVGRRRR